MHSGSLSSLPASYSTPLHHSALVPLPPSSGTLQLARLSPPPKEKKNPKKKPPTDRAQRWPPSHQTAREREPLRDAFNGSLAAMGRRRPVLDDWRDWRATPRPRKRMRCALSVVGGCAARYCCCCPGAAGRHGHACGPARPSLASHIRQHLEY